MARRVTERRRWVSTVAAWLFGFLIFFPILWMMLTSFKTELDAFATPPSFLFFHRHSYLGHPRAKSPIRRRVSASFQCASASSGRSLTAFS